MPNAIDSESAALARPGHPAFAAMPVPVLLLLVLVLMLCAVMRPARAQAQAPADPAARASAPQSPPPAAEERNVYRAGGHVRPQAPILGDFAAAGGRVVLDQPVSGDAALAGGSVDVRAPIGEDLRAGGGDISIESAVGGELFATGGMVTLTPAARVGRSATLYAGELTINGRIEDDLTARGRRIVLDGVVGGDADLAGEQVELGPNARIQGTLRYASGAELKRAEGAVVTGAVTRESMPSPRPHERAREARQVAEAEGVPWIGGFLLFLGLLAFAALLLLVAPLFARRSADQVKASPGLALALGFAAAIAVPVLAALLFITILGIPLGLLVLSVYPVLLLFGLLIGVLWIARLLAAALRRAAGESFGLGMLFFALALLVVLLLSNVPIAGPIAVALLTLAGLGALLLEIRGRRRGPGTLASA